MATELELLEAPLSKLFPDLFGIFRPIVTADVPVLVAASILGDYEFPILPVSRDGRHPGLERYGVPLFKAIGGQQVFKLVLKSKPEDYHDILWGPCSTICMWLGTVEFQDTFERLLRIFEITGVGDARVNADASHHGLVTLEEAVSLYRGRKLRCGMSVKEVSSRVVPIEPVATVLEAMRLMCEKRVRRLFLKESPEYVSDRSILAFLFSPRLLTIARDRPESWTNAPLSDVQRSVAAQVSEDATVEEVAMTSEAGREVSMLSDGASLVSRWDLVMKPWKARQLHLSV